LTERVDAIRAMKAGDGAPPEEDTRRARALFADTKA
jgi:hypothetical protein